MVELLKYANNGLYHPKGYMKEEMLNSVLFLWLGDSHVADLAHKSLGWPGI